MRGCEEAAVLFLGDINALGSVDRRFEILKQISACSASQVPFASPPASSLAHVGEECIRFDSYEYDELEPNKGATQLVDPIRDVGTYCVRFILAVLEPQ
jgi:hypothetical protein